MLTVPKWAWATCGVIGAGREILGTPVPMDVIEYMLQEETRTIVTLLHRTVFRRLFQALFPSLYDTVV